MSAYGLDRFTEFCRQLDAPKPRYDEQEPVKVSVERWTVYSFTLPIKYSKKIALGFESRVQAQAFIGRHLSQKAKELEIDGLTYSVHYDVIRDSRGEIDIYFNEPPVTVSGNDPHAVLEQWVG